MNSPIAPAPGAATPSSAPPTLELQPLPQAESEAAASGNLPPPPTTPLPMRASAPTPPQRFEFTGSGAEYFKIWIVNVLLTIVTLGIYSAWAKVRRLRYFYNNTRFAGSSFDFHGSPIAILKGRIIAVLLIMGLQVPFVQIAVLALYLIALPWLLQRSLRFQLANTSYRNLRFAFLGTAKDAYAALLTPIGIVLAAALVSGLVMWKLPLFGGIMLLITLLAFYGIVPYIQYRMRRYFTEGARAGASPFALHFGAGEYYVVYVVAFGFVLALGAIATVVIAFTLGLETLAMAKSGNLPTGKILVAVALVSAIYIAMLAVGPLIVAMLQNTVWRGTSLADKRFKSSVPVPKFMLTWLGVTFLTLITLGLYRPFAVVKLARMRVEAMAWTGSADAMIAVLREANQKAVGSEVSDLMDVDVAL